MITAINEVIKTTLAVMMMKDNRILELLFVTSSLKNSPKVNVSVETNRLAPSHPLSRLNSFLNGRNIRWSPSAITNIDSESNPFKKQIFKYKN